MQEVSLQTDPPKLACPTTLATTCSRGNCFRYHSARLVANARQAGRHNRQICAILGTPHILDSSWLRRKFDTPPPVRPVPVPVPTPVPVVPVVPRADSMVVIPSPVNWPRVWTPVALMTGAPSQRAGCTRSTILVLKSMTSDCGLYVKIASGNAQLLMPELPSAKGVKR